MLFASTTERETLSGEPALRLLVPSMARGVLITTGAQYEQGADNDWGAVRALLYLLAVSTRVRTCAHRFA